MKRVLFALVLFLLFVDVVSAQVCFQGPQGITRDSNGNTYISDTLNNRILKRDSAGVVSVFAGSGTAGFNPGTSGSAVGTAATFNQPHKIMINPAGTYLYVADTNNHAIRKIEISSRTVTTVAGNGPNYPGSTNGPFNAAKFNSPKGLFVTTLGEIVVADTGNNKLRLINEVGNGDVSDFAGGGTGSVSCTSLAVGACPSNIPCGSMPLNAPEDVVISTTLLTGPGPTHYYETLVADTGNNGVWALRYTSPSLCAGSWIAGRGTAGAGYNTGPSQVVQFSQPSAIDAVNYYPNGNPIVNTYTSSQDFFVVDRGNNVLRYTHIDGSGTNPATSYTVAGSYQSSGSADGTAIFPISSLVAPASASTARLNAPTDIYIKSNGNFEYNGNYDFLILETSNKIRRLSDSAPATANGVWNVNTLMTCGGGGITPISCASADDTILRLSDTTNAHGEVYNGAGNYPIGICYSTIFGGTAPTNPSRTCSGNNKVVRLSSPTNAHAEIPGNNNYGTEICYQGLNCYSVAGNAACSTSNPVEYEVVSLSGATNAHLGVAGTYGTKICCSNAPANSLSNAEWRNFNNQPFNTPPGTNPNSAGNPVCVNQYVNAHVQANGFSNSQQSVYYELWDDDLIFDDCIFGISSTSCDNAGVYGNIVNGESTFQFQLIQDIFDATGENDPQLYFKVASTSSIPLIVLNSGNLYTSDNPSACIYGPPIALITAPVHRGIYYANTNNINFVSGCSSPNEPLNYNWEIIQGGQSLPLGANQNLSTFQYTFANPGQALVRLTCTGVVSGLSASAENQILVVASPFVLAYINQPGLNGVAYVPPPASGPYFRTQMSFSASDSFAVDANIQGSTCSVNCIAGNCPTETKNSPLICGQGGGPIPVTGTPASYNTVKFDWTFWDSNFNEPWTSNEGAGIHSGTVSYDDVSNAINDKHVNVTIIYPVSGATTASASFKRDFTLGRCLDNGNTYLNPNGQTQATTGNNPVLEACRGGDGVKQTEDDCCPNLHICDEDTNTPVTGDVCIVQQTPINSCDDLNNMDQCNNWINYISLQTLINSYYPGGVAPICTTLKCSWVTGGNNPNTCQTEEISYQQNGTGACDPTIPCVSGCTWVTEQTACENGQKTIRYSGTSTNSCSNTGCTKDSVTVPCGGLNFELGFFEYTQFIAAAIVIALIYVAFGIRRRNV